MKFDVYNYTSGEKQKFSYENPYTGNYGEAFDKFHHYYQPDLIAPHPDKKMRLAKKSIKSCRFCFRTSEQVSFKKIAHVLPQLLGNKFIIHDSECDECNLILGKYEDSLGKYIGMMRTADAIRGQGGIPVYKSVDKKLVLRFESENNQNYISIYHNSPDVQKLANGGSIQLAGIKQPYTPLHVWKSFQKIGYSLQDFNSLSDYSASRQILMGSNLDNKLKQFAFAFKITTARPFATPLVVTYAKKQEHINLNMPSKVVFLYFGRFVYEYFLLNTNDSFMYISGQDVEIIFSPPFYGGPQSEVHAMKVDFSSPELKKGELDEATFTFDPI